MESAKVFLGITLILVVVGVTVLSALRVEVPPILPDLAFAVVGGLAGLGGPLLGKIRFPAAAEEPVPTQTQTVVMPATPPAPLPTVGSASNEDIAREFIKRFMDRTTPGAGE